MVLKWPPRALLSLAVEGLPLGCRLFSHMEGGPDRWREFHGWDKTRHMLADQWDLLVAVNTEKGKKAQTYPRPSTAPPASQGTPLFAMRPRAPKGE